MRGLLRRRTRAGWLRRTTGGTQAAPGCPPVSAATADPREQRVGTHLPGTLVQVALQAHVADQREPGAQPDLAEPSNRTSRSRLYASVE